MSKYLLFLFLIVCQTVIVRAQQKDYVELEANVIVDGGKGKVDGAAIDIEINGKETRRLEINQNGQFIYRLKFNNEFKFTFSKPGHISRIVIVSSIVPKSSLYLSSDFPPLLTGINLLPDIDGMDKTFGVKPYLKWYYDSLIDDFKYEIIQDTGQFSKQIDQAITQDKQVKKEEKIVDKLDAQELLEAQREYDKIIKEADGLFVKAEYYAAIGKYNEAHKIFLERPYPNERIKEIENLLAALGLNEKQNLYEDAIVEADKAYKKKDFTLAETEYKKASGIKPEEKYPQEQIARIGARNASQNAEQLKTRQFASLVASGDSLYNIRKLEDAKIAFTKAFNLFPDQSYPERKIQQINTELKALADQTVLQKQTETSYNASIFRGDMAFKNKQYESARMAYQEAARIKSEEMYPKEKIAELDKLLEAKGLSEENERLYAENIKNAEKAFNENNLELAKIKYETALKFKSEAQLPIQRIAIINKIFEQRADIERMAKQEAEQHLNADKTKRERYQQAISTADAFFKQKKYSEARSSYLLANSALPDEKYPKNRINEIDNLLDELNFQDAVLKQKAVRDSVANAKKLNINKSGKQADQLASNKEFVPAITKQNEPPVVLPSEKTEITEKINNIGDQQRISEKQEMNYETIISMADKLYYTSKYDKASVLYSDALNAKPDAQYPKSQIRNIQEILKNRENEYAAIIVQADDNFKKQKWQSAKNDYIEALEFKAGDVYASGQIQKINQQMSMMLVSDIDELLNRKAYEDMLRQGEESLANKNYKDAKMIFEIAKALKPIETFPDQRIKEIDQLINQQNVVNIRSIPSTEDDSYRQLIAIADQAYRNKTYDEAIKQYKNALNVKPGEQYPQKQIDLINEQTGRKVVVETSVPKIAPAKPVTGTNDLKPASGQSEYRGTSPRYLENLNVSETNKLYNETIMLADESFNQKDYSVSRFFYYKASDIKPSEDYPRKRIEEIGRLIDIGLSADIRSSYDNAVKQGDESFAKKTYTVAKFYYNNALEIKSWERYPKDRIHEIQVLTNSLLSEREERKFNESIAQADEAYYAKNYSVARFHYNQALTVKPEERYPKIKIEDIKKLIEKEKHEDVKLEYMNQLKLGDLAFEQGNLSVARFYYNKASGIQKNEQYPKDQIRRIEEILAKRRE